MTDLIVASSIAHGIERDISVPWELEFDAEIAAEKKLGIRCNGSAAFAGSEQDRYAVLLVSDGFYVANRHMMEYFLPKSLKFSVSIVSLSVAVVKRGKTTSKYRTDLQLKTGAFFPNSRPYALYFIGAVLCRSDSGGGKTAKSVILCPVLIWYGRWC